MTKEKMNKILAVILMIFVMLQAVNAQIAINSFSSNPSTIAPGKNVEVSITLENVGKDDIEDIIVRLDLSQVPFAPIGSASEKVIDKLNEDDVATVTFDLVALPDASSQIYKIPVKVSHGLVNQESLVSLTVAGQAKLDVVLESSELLKVGDKGKTIVKFVNNGLTDIKFLTVKLIASNGYELLSADTIYIGQVDVDDFETAEFDMIAKSENPEMIFNLNYKDANNKEFSQNKIVNLNIYSLEEAKQLGLVTSNYTGLIIGLVVIVLIAFFAYRRYKRRKLKL